mmetsp:Transcript_14540/g.36919  ORF Transcript_14540/g.36919 Transcript_14540/m.36919 type:complete len:145 (+) Transcript_14540:38-472(+)
MQMSGIEFSPMCCADYVALKGRRRGLWAAAGAAAKVAEAARDRIDAMEVPIGDWSRPGITSRVVEDMMDVVIAEEEAAPAYLKTDLFAGADDALAVEAVAARTVALSGVLADEPAAVVPRPPPSGTPRRWSSSRNLNAKRASTF